MKRPRLIRPSYLLWVPIVAAAYAGYATFGTPHLIWSYSFELHGSNDRWDYAARHYTSCTFVGMTGVFARNAIDGRCHWIAFRRDDEAGGVQ